MRMPIKYGLQRFGLSKNKKNLISPFSGSIAMATDEECNKEFSIDYLLLKQEERGFHELLRILHPGDIRKFVERRETAVPDFERRWLIFTAILMQKGLQFGAYPMSKLGSAIEWWLNLTSINGGFGNLLFNFLRGKIQQPIEGLPTYLSCIGHLDKRLELDKTIKPGDRRYHAELSMMSSKIVYENEACIRTIVEDLWKMKFRGFFNFRNEYQDKDTTQAFILHDKNVGSDTIVVAFRGTEPFDADAWCTDLDMSWYEIEGVGRIHAGFMKALGLQKSQGWPRKIEDPCRRRKLAYYRIKEILKEQLRANHQTNFLVTGHSLGGALAILFPAVLAMHGKRWMLKRLQGVYTFGQPRVGDEAFGKFMIKHLNEHNIPHFRFVYNNDFVPRLPYDNKALMFKHFGTCLYFDSCYKEKIVEEVPHKNYFPLLSIPMMLNAMFELVRSFTIVHSYGKEYEEGWFLIVLRVIGIIFPGFSAHCPQDYVNCTRLGYLIPSEKK